MTSVAKRSAPHTRCVRAVLRTPRGMGCAPAKPSGAQGTKRLVSPHQVRVNPFCDHSAVVHPPPRDRSWRRLASAAEQHFEEARAACIGLRPACSAGARLPGWAAVVRLCLGHRHVRRRAFATLEQRKQTGIAAIDVVAELQVAGIIHERGLIGDVDRDRRREFDVGLASCWRSCAGCGPVSRFRSSQATSSPRRTSPDPAPACSRG